MRRYLLDTNVIVRFLLGDHPDHSPKAARLFASAEKGDCTLLLNDVAIAEVAWLLTSFYKADRQSVAQRISEFITADGVQCPNMEVLLDAASRFGSTKCDFFDCYLAAMAAVSGDQIATFDRDFRKFADVTCFDWRSPPSTPDE